MTSNPGFADGTSTERRLHVAVASSFRPAADEIARRFSAQTGIDVTLSSAASGLLAAQILQGAPFDLFLSADEARPRAVLGTGEGRDAPVCYARGTLVLLGARDLGANDLGAKDRDTALADASLSVAIANPRSAPYGKAAEAVLRRRGVAGPEARRVVQGANVLQALQFFERGAADLALVARAVSPNRGIALPTAWHPPIDQYAVVVAQNERALIARQFLAFLLSDATQSRLQNLGYKPCP